MDAIILADRGNFKNPGPSEAELAHYKNMAIAAVSALANDFNNLEPAKKNPAI